MAADHRLTALLPLLPLLLVGGPGGGIGGGWGGVGGVPTSASPIFWGGGAMAAAHRLTALLPLLPLVLVGGPGGVLGWWGGGVGWGSQPQAALYVGGACRWLAESARWLVLAGKEEKAVRILRRVAKINGREEEGEKITVEVRPPQRGSGGASVCHPKTPQWVSIPPHSTQRPHNGSPSPPIPFKDPAMVSIPP